LPRVSKTRLAEKDLDDIWFHIAVDNPDAADRVLDAINERCALLAQHTRMGRARPELAPDLRSSPSGRYVLYYRPDAEGIELVRVLDGAREVNALFDSDTEQDR
jgi:toxin ParE1/3/4